MISKRGQLSYEYVIIIGMILVLLIPFFYNLFISLSGQVSGYFAAEAVNIIADATQTVAHLGPKNYLQVNVRLQGAATNTISGNMIGVTLDSGEEVTAVGANNVYSGIETLTGTGYFTIPIATASIPNGAVVVGKEPVITCIAPQGYDVTANPCPFKLKHNQKMAIYGKNFDTNPGQLVVAITLGGNPKGGSLNTVTPEVIKMQNAIGEKGNGFVYVTNSPTSANAGNSRTVAFQSV